MSKHKCQRCETKPAFLGMAFFVQREQSPDGDTSETEYQLCLDCIDGLEEYLSGETLPAINHRAAIKAGKVGRGKSARVPRYREDE